MQPSVGPKPSPTTGNAVLPNCSKEGYVQYLPTSKIEGVAAIWKNAKIFPLYFLTFCDYRFQF